MPTPGFPFRGDLLIILFLRYIQVIFFIVELNICTRKILSIHKNLIFRLKKLNWTQINNINMKKVFFIGIGWVGVSALARYYRKLWYEVSWSDGGKPSFVTDTLEAEWVKVFFGHNEANLGDNTNFVIYSEAIITNPNLNKEENLKANPELAKAIKLNIKSLSYPEALAEVVNKKKCIAVAWTHGKSTTTSILWVILAGGTTDASVLVGAPVKQFNNSNLYFGAGDYFAIEACEYKRSFLKYLPFITVITNIEIDHLDYYKDLEDYMSAFRSLQSQTSGYIILNWNDQNCLALKDIGKLQIFVYDKYFENLDWEKIYFPEFNLQIPGDHIEFDAKLAYTVAKLLGLDDAYIVSKINSYTGIWRRSEIVWTTKSGNLVMSDYGHHPTEIKLTLESIKQKYHDKQIFVIFQPHQYSRTIELLDWFKTSFDSADSLIIPDIYFSRDKKEDVEFMTTDRFVSELKQNYPNTINGNGLENTLELIKDYDEKNPNSSVIVLLWAGSVDDLRRELV